MEDVMSKKLGRWSGYLVTAVALAAGVMGCQSETGLQGHCDDRYVVQGGRGDAVGAPECPPRDGQCLTAAEACTENVCGGVDDRCGGMIHCGPCEGSCNDVELECGDHGQCEDDEEGLAQCVCEEGYVGPYCLPEDSCLSEAQACTEGVCGGVDDLCGGVVDCGACEGSCEEVELDCGEQGQCETNDEGIAECVCEEGYEGLRCGEPIEVCLTPELACTEGVCGGVDDLCGGVVDCGACEGSCEEVELDCGEQGQCETNDDGIAECVCEAGYEGLRCDEPTGACLTREQACTEGVCGGVDNGCGAFIDCGACEGSCEEVELDCGEQGRCVDDEEGNAQCICEEGRAGLACGECADGYFEVDGTCRADCTVFDATCSGQGSCEVPEGGEQGLCVCEGDRMGDLCEACPEGTQDNDGDGVCEVSCEEAALACGVGGSCDDSSGQAQCACRPGFAGEQCESCAEGYQDNNDDGECRLGCDNTTIEACPSTQVCDDSSGIAQCLCTEGAQCETCDEGYALLNGACVFAPQNCSAILEQSPGSGDGTYDLFYEGDPLKPWVGYCAGMETGTPVEYLPFVRTGRSRNFASYTSRLLFIGESVRTVFSAVRIDPETLVIDINDFTFAATSAVGTPEYMSVPVNQMPFGTAATCGILDATSGNIDLRGTPFRVQSNFCSSSLLQANFSRDRQVVNLTIGLLGCYWMAPNPCPSEVPINDFGDSDVVLEYRGF
ncbi:hypothetical protein DV096_19260 [Bradymonadaceae bacterium TMQ3]|nr:hypothetical protein DV096_19260 [Bradymonadaceae bacterium TMQ3]TXC68448.1 hypothetical protein FRC91_19045 [Bradymonadales bacterium TMQ1]